MPRLPRVWDPVLCAWRLPDIRGAHNSFTIDQDSFRWSNNDDDEASATYFAAVNTSIIVGTGEDADFAYGDVLRLRFLFQETGGDSAGNNLDAQLQYNINGAGWNDVNASSSAFQSIASLLVDGNDTTTTRRLGAGTFTTPNAGQEEGDGLAGGTSLDVAAGAEWELEFSFQALNAGLTDGDTVQFRVVHSSQVPDTPTTIPTMLTVSESVAGDGAVTFPNMTAAAVGEQPHEGAGAVTFPNMTASGAGTHPPVGSAAVTFPNPTAAATGTHGTVHSGAGAVTFPKMTAAAVAYADQIPFELHSGYAALNDEATERGVMKGQVRWQGTSDGNTQIPMPFSGTVRNLRWEVDTDPGAGGSETLALRINGVNSALAATISNGQTSAEDLSDEPTFSAGALLNFEKFETSAPTRFTEMFASVELEFDGAQRGFFGGLTGGSQLDTTGQQFYHPDANAGGGSAAAGDMDIIVPMAMDLEALYFNSGDPGAGTYEIDIFIDGSASGHTQLPLVHSADGTTSVTLDPPIAVTRGQTISLEITGVSSPTAHAASWSIGYRTKEDMVVAKVMHPAFNSPSTSVAEYHGIEGAFSDWVASESGSGRPQHYRGNRSLWRDLLVEVTDAPGAGASWVVALREDGADVSSGPSVTISDSETQDEDTTNTYNPPRSGFPHELSYGFTPSSTPAGTNFRVAIKVEVLRLKEAAAAVTFPSMTAAAAGTHGSGAPSGAGVVTFPNPVAVVGAGAHIHAGAAATTFPSPTAAAQGTLQPEATAVVTFPSPVSVVASGAHILSATAAVTFPRLTATAQGTLQPEATAAVTFPSPTAAAFGAVAEFVGLAAVNLPGFTATAQGFHPPSATAAVSFPKPTASGQGKAFLAAVAVVTFPSFTAAAQGFVPEVGAAATTFPKITAAGVGKHAYAGVAVVVFPNMTAAGTGGLPITIPGAAIVVFPSITTAAVSEAFIPGAGAVTFPALEVVAVGGNGFPIASATATLVRQETARAAILAADTPSATLVVAGKPTGRLEVKDD